MDRKQILMSNNFFKDKEKLVDLLISAEKNHSISLPNQFKFKHTSPLEVNDSQLSLWRIDSFYALEIKKNSNPQGNYQIFRNEIEIRSFLVENNPDEIALNFWLRQLELICD